MAKSAQAPNGADTIFGALLTTVHDGQDTITRAWSQNCDLYARYFAALSRAHGPEDLLAANAQLMLGGMDAVTRAASSPRVHDATQPQA